MHSFSHFRPADIHTPKNTLRSLEAEEFQQHVSEVVDSPGAARSRGAQPSSRTHGATEHLGGSETGQPTPPVCPRNSASSTQRIP